MFTPENCLQRMYAAPYKITDPGDGGIILCNQQLGMCEMASGASAETRELQDPTKPGIQLILRLMTDGGGDIIVHSDCGFNAALEEYATFAEASDMLSLVSVCVTPNTFRWEVFGDDSGNLGATLSA